MIGFPIGLVYSNAIEWLVHKYLLHGIGKKKGSFWAFHWVGHHRSSRRNQMYDSDYEKPLGDWNGRGKEAVSIGLLCAAHLPLIGVAPYFTAAVCYSGFNYLRKHKKAHLDPEWAMKHMKWHVDHHMGKNQDANWCVTQPWFDHILGTRIDYAPTALKMGTARNMGVSSGDVANDVAESDTDATEADAPCPGSPGLFPPPVAA